jgi:hypothetical protein
MEFLEGEVKSYETQIVGKSAVPCGFFGDHAANPSSAVVKFQRRDIK